MVAAAHGSVKPPNPLGKPKRAGKYDFQSVASRTSGIYSAMPRVSRPGDGDTADVNHLLIWISAALGACVVLLAVFAATLKRRSGLRDERVSDVVLGLERRMDELMHELAGAVERAEEEGRRGRFLVEIAASIELDVVLARTLEAATTAIERGDASVIQLDNQDGGPTMAAHGLSADGAEPIAGPPDGSRARAIEVAYRYADDTEEHDRPIHGGLAVPLEESGGRIGFLTVFTKDRHRRFGEEDVRRLEELALRAGPALENARRFREARQLADLDALTGLHNRRYFHETLARECARAHRYSRRLALVVFDVDDFKDVNDRIGHLAGDAVLAEAAERVREVTRSADVPCRVGGDEFAVILPESGIEQADQLFGRIQAAVSGRPIGQAGRMKLSAGVAELEAEDDSISFFQRADEALYRAKEAGKGRSVTADSRTA
jgi:diguanylate cyclase (GGDEF)-like protein